MQRVRVAKDNGQFSLALTYSEFRESGSRDSACAPEVHLRAHIADDIDERGSNVQRDGKTRNI